MTEAPRTAASRLNSAARLAERFRSRSPAAQAKQARPALQRRSGRPPTGKNPCSPNPCMNGGNCVQQGDAALCACAKGYRGDLCELDIDECLDDNGGCGASECINTSGSFKCGDCDEGYVKDETGDCIDIDECVALTEAGYDPRTDCTNTPGGYTVHGLSVWTLWRSKTAASDLNECLSDPCDESLELFSRTSAPETTSVAPARSALRRRRSHLQRHQPVQPSAPAAASPAPGLHQHRGLLEMRSVRLRLQKENGLTQCDDVDSVKKKIDECEKGYSCHSLIGSYECLSVMSATATAHCDNGYTCENTKGGFDCIDIDECEAKTDGCDLRLLRATNTEGSYECDDIDECEAKTDDCDRLRVQQHRGPAGTATTSIECESQDLDDCTRQTSSSQQHRGAAGTATTSTSARPRPSTVRWTPECLNNGGLHLRRDRVPAGGLRRRRDLRLRHLRGLPYRRRDSVRQQLY